MARSAVAFAAARAVSVPTGVPIAVSLALAVAGLSACAGKPTPANRSASVSVSAPTSAPTTSLQVLGASIRQFREDEVAGVVQIELHGGTAAIDVRSVELEWTGVNAAVPVDHPLPLTPGRIVDIAVPWSGSTCRGERDSAIVRVRAVDGATFEAAVDREGVAVLGRIAAADCAARRLAEQVHLELAGPWVEPANGGSGNRLVGTLQVTRGASALRLAVESVDGSVLLTTDLRSTVVLDPGEAAGSAPLAVTPSGRCDGHALGESKQTFRFQAQVRIGGGAPVGVDLTVPDADRPALFAAIRRACGLDP